MSENKMLFTSLDVYDAVKWGVINNCISINGLVNTLALIV